MRLGLKSAQLKTPLGVMLTVADQKALYLLAFVDEGEWERKLRHLSQSTGLSIKQGLTDPIVAVREELEQYFAHRLTRFETPLRFVGTPFERQVWAALCQIPYGSTFTYKQVAEAVGHPTAFRAVARANASNRLALMVPCHRVVRSNGQLGGYDGGITRKVALIELEKAQ